MKRLTASPDAFCRISRGSSVLTDRITTGAGEWVRAGRREDLDGVRATLGCWVRAGLLLGSAWIAYQVLRAAPNLMWACTGVWCWKAWRASSAAPAAEGAAVPDAADGEERSGQTPGVDLAKPAVPGREQLTAALHQVADPHAHLASLARALGVDTAAVREGLAQAGIPISGGCREGGRVSTGVKRDHFPPLPAAPGTPVVAAESAGQPDNNNSNNSGGDRRPYRTREGFWITPDPDRAHGWNVTAPRT